MDHSVEDTGSTAVTVGVDTHPDKHVAVTRLVRIAATGGDLHAFGSADRLASLAGIVPVPRDTARWSGRPK